METFLVEDDQGNVEELFVTESMRLVMTLDGPRRVGPVKKILMTSDGQIANPIIDNGLERYVFRGRWWRRVGENGNGKPLRSAVAL